MLIYISIDDTPMTMKCVNIIHTLHTIFCHGLYPVTIRVAW